MNSAREAPRTTWILAGAAILLLILHQDFWLWDSQALWFGFLPAGLGYHACFSMAAAGLWAWGLRFAWPTHIEALAEERHDAA
jgi:hypothetical protein